MPRCTIIDTTLRDGLQAPGVVFSTAQRIELAEQLDNIGVDEIEVGCPAMGDDERAIIHATAQRNLRCRLTGWCRATEADLDAAANCGLAAVHFGVPASDVQLDVFNKSWPWVIATLETLLPIARRRFDYVSVGIMDASRSPFDRLEQVTRQVRELGGDRVRLADTVGLWNPMAMAETVTRLRVAVPDLTLGVHTHNDLGMAVANAVTAVQAGADSVDVTVGGIGERAGNAALEQVAMALSLNEHTTCQIDTTALAALCDRVAVWRGVGHTDDQPIVGRNIFRHESGIHQRGVVRDPQSFEPFGPEAVGRAGRAMVVGSHSGRAGLIAVLQSMQIEPAREVVDALLPQVREQAANLGEIPPQQLAAMYWQLSQGEHGREVSQWAS